MYGDIPDITFMLYHKYITPTIILTNPIFIIQIVLYMCEPRSNSDVCMSRNDSYSGIYCVSMLRN